MECEFKVVKLHDVPDVLEETARLLNSEWPRSLQARCDVIGRSSDDLPCSFVLLKVLTDSDVQAVVGFSHLSKVLQKPKSVLIESVLVDKALRGCGLGRMIMRHTEEFALKHGYEMVHLSTHDKQSFYEHLGYSLSTPVSAETKVARFFPKLQNQDGLVMHGEINSLKGTSNTETKEEETSQLMPIPPHPCPKPPTPCPKPPSPCPIPPPPCPKPPPPCPIPPPPPPLSQTPKKQISSSPGKNVEKTRSKVYVWMKKQLYCPDNPF